MADITSKLQGNVSNEGKQNWRGDQVSAPQGGQSIYDSSSVQLAELGSRKVVGDRVFRYSLAKADIGAAMTVQYAGECALKSIAVGSSVTQPAGLRTFTVTAATAISKDTYADGYLVCEAGATDSNLGMVYGIKSNDYGSAAGTCKLYLYDEIKCALKLTSTWALYQNLYMNVASGSATGVALGISPIDVTTGDYFWLQTWGPAAVAGTVAQGSGAINSVSGLCTLMAATGQTIGGAMKLIDAATNWGLLYLTIAP
jgi:hypothetical protein